MLKRSNEKDVELFAARVISFINPKSDDPDAEFPLAAAEIKDFAKDCQLTAEEFLSALRLATKGKLIGLDGNPIKLFREIDILKFGEIEAAYIEYKNLNPVYTKSKKELKQLIEAPKEPTPEEMAARRNNLWDELLDRVSKGVPCNHAFLFYEEFKEKGYFAGFLKSKHFQKKLQQQKMKEILISARINGKSIHFRMNEVDRLLDQLNQGKEVKVIPFAITEIKGDLVYKHIKRHLSEYQNEQ
ncbi:hypothetical protein BAZ12_19500 [Elizabethkingia miricola]|uniref:hypothetical protein n=1 Tax=Elizabethkingia miricola TaxID=172045 RepID=UPI00099A2C8D|nr:hypothetical protein [Elizabethkingia miricola]OPC76197.1 hypothetical protein BAZ12_19500 [Elizabethkingia miricola]